MTRRALFVALSALALAVWATAPAAAQDKTGAGGAHDGYVVKAGDGKLTMTAAKGAREQHTHMVATDAKITCDGKECKLEDLKAGDHVTVTEETQAGRKVVTKIVATRAGADRKGGRDK